MKLHVTPCENEDFSQNYIKAELINRVLVLQDGKKIEVEYYFPPETITHSDSKFNTMFKNRNDELPEDDRKYFTLTTYWQRQSIKWMYGDFDIQKKETVWKIIIPIFTFWLGYLLYVLTHDC